jgi:glycosyltransferase involved in cell wall biosynthesis
MICSLHIIGSRQLGGAERFFARLTAELARAGHPTHALLRPHSPLRRELVPTLPQHTAPMMNGWDWFSLWRIRQTVTRLAPDIVQTYMGRASRLTHVPRTTSSIHVARLGGFYRIEGYYRHAHAWVGNTRGVCDYLVRSGLPAERVYQIGNFVPAAPPPNLVQRSDRRRSLGVPADAWLVFALGRFVEKKGFTDLLHAMAQLPGAVAQRPVWLVLAGDGPQMPLLQRLGNDLGLAPRLRWTGWQRDPAPLFAVADLLVCPSRHEPLGNVILEAWAHGLPVVATRTDGAAELIADGSNGRLTAVQDPLALARAIRELLSDDRLRRELATRGAACLARHHSPAMVVEGYLTMYRELLKA